MEENLPSPASGPFPPVFSSPVTPIPQTPPSVFSPPPFPPPVQKKKRPLLFFLLFLFLFFLSISSISILLAYEKISLSNPSVQIFLSDLIQGLSFTPKTPSYLFRQALQKQPEIKNFFLDFSLNLQLEGIGTTIPGGEVLNLVLKGPIDLSNPYSPRFSLNLLLGKNFSLDFLAKEKIFYFKVNKLPEEIFSSLTTFGIEKEALTPFLEKWYFSDFSSLESAASLEITKYQQKENEEEKKRWVDFFQKEILPLVSLSSDTLDNLPTYQLHLPLSPATLLKIIEEVEKTSTQGEKANVSEKEISEMIESLSFDFWLDKKDYYLRTFSFLAKIKSPPRQERKEETFLKNLPVNLFLPKSAKLMGVLKLSDLNRRAEVKVPSEATNVLELINSFHPKSFSSPQTSPLESSPSAQAKIIDFPSAYSQLRQLANSIARFTINKMTIPKSLIELEAAGEITSSFRKTLEEAKIFFVFGKEGENVFIYTLTPDPSNSEKPYLGAKISQSALFEFEHYSVLELTQIIANLE